jgi:hypothetical protein
MEMNAGGGGGGLGNVDFKATIYSTGYDRSEMTGECGIFQVFLLQDKT